MNIKIGTVLLTRSGREYEVWNSNTIKSLNSNNYGSILIGWPINHIEKQIEIGYFTIKQMDYEIY